MRPVAKGVARQIVGEVIAHVRSAHSRDFLALVGVMMGAGAVIAMLHVGHNARRAALRQFETLGTDLVMMQPQSSGPFATAQVSLGEVLDLPGQKLGISDVAAMVQSGGSVRYERTKVQASLIAATEGLYALGKARIDRGRSTSDLDGYQPFAVLGSGIASDLQADRSAPVAIGDRITVSDQTLMVIGILSKTPPNFILNVEFDRAVVIPFAAARRVIPGPTITNIGGRLSAGADDIKTAAAVARYFEARMAGGSMQVNTARAMIENIDEQMTIYAALILATGAVSLLVGGVGIMNVMLMSVMERRQEIGLRMAIGARRGDIMLSFLTEAFILSALGSAIGTVLGFFAGWLFADMAGWQFEAAPLAVPTGAGMAVVVGLFFGIYPALRASRLDPIAALRGEG
jgi:putative ABC transport system permease protein